MDPAFACGQEYTIAAVPPGAGNFGPIQTILSSCVGCHNATNAAPGSSFNVAGLNLDPAVAYGNIVDVNSTELPTMKRIAFGTATELTSYLWHKINNSHGGLPGPFVSPGPGVAMPQGSAGLVITQPAQALTIRNWITAGALP